MRTGLIPDEFRSAEQLAQMSLWSDCFFTEIWFQWCPVSLISIARK